MLRILVLLLLTVQAYGQLTFETFAPTHHVNGVAVDADDKIWVATNGGVLKYDHNGTLLKTYTNADGLIHNQVTSILIASNGDIWFGTWDGGISRLRGDNWESYELLVQLGYDIASIAEDANGNIWFSGQHYLRGGAMFDGTDMSLVNESTTDIPNNSISAIAADGETVWFGAGDKIASYDGIDWLEFPGLPGVLAIDIDSHGDKWFAGGESILRLSGSTFTTISKADLGLATDEYLNTIYIDDDDNLWIGAVKADRTGDLIRYSIDTQQSTRFTDPVYEIQQILKVGNDLYVATGFWTVSGKLYRFDGTTWFEYTKDNTPNSYVTTCSMEDANGNMWFGTHSGLTPGVTKFDGTTFTGYNLGGNVHSLAQTPNGDIFAGMVGAIKIFQSGSWSSFYTAAGYVLQMAIDSQGNLWASMSPGGIAKYDGTSWTTYDMSNTAMVSNDVVDLSIDGDDNVWIAYSSNNVVSRLSSGTVTNFSSANSGLVDGEISHILATPDNTVLASVYDEGIYKYELGQWSLLFDEDNSPVPDIATNEIQLDAGGNYWFAGIMHVNGPPFVAVYNGNRWKTYSHEIAGNPVYSLTPDHLGNIWVTTQWGITKISGDPFAKVNQTIDFDQLPEKTFGDLPFDLTAESTSQLGITYASSDETVATINAGSVTIVGVGSTTITASQSGDVDYFAAVPVDRVLTVVKAPQDISFASLPAKAFKDAPFDLDASTDSGLPIAYASSDLTVATIAGTKVTIVGAGSTTITATQPGDNNYDAATPVGQPLVVNKASQLITFNTISTKFRDDVPFDLTATSDSQLPVAFTSSNTAVATISGNTVTIVGAGATTITASQAGDDDYAASTKDQQLVVNKVLQQITFTTLPAKAIGDAPFNLTATSNSQLPIAYTSSNTAVATINGSTVTIVGAGTTTIKANQAGDDFYAAAAEEFQVLVVSKTAQQITFTSLPVKVIGDAPFNLTASSNSQLPVAYTSSNAAVATISGSTVTIVGVGTTTIKANQPGNGNYAAAAEESQVLTVDKRSQVITFNTLASKVFGESAFSLTATSSSLLSVTYTSSDATIATINNTTLTIVGAGIVTITASQAGNAEYKAADPVARQLTVSKAAQTITFAQLSDKTIGDASFQLSATATSALAVTFTSTSDKITIAGSQVSLVKAGRATVTASQPGNIGYSAAVAVDQSFCIRPAKPVITVSNVNSSSPVLTSSATTGNQWYKDGKAIADGTNATFNATEAGVYVVQAKVDDCASLFSDNQALIVLAVSETMSQISIYPNPAGDYIELAGVNESISSVDVVDMKGRMTSLAVERDGEAYRGDVQHLAAGIYLVRVQQGNTVQMVKVVKK